MSDDIPLRLVVIVATLAGGLLLALPRLGVAQSGSDDRDLGSQLQKKVDQAGGEIDEANNAAGYQTARKLLSQGKKAYRAGKYERAEKLFLSAFDAYEDPVALYYAGLAQLNLDRCNAAERHFQRADTHELGLSDDVADKLAEARNQLPACRDRVVEQTVDQAEVLAAEGEHSEALETLRTTHDDYGDPRLLPPLIELHVGRENCSKAREHLDALDQSNITDKLDDSRVADIERVVQKACRDEPDNTESDDEETHADSSQEPVSTSTSRETDEASDDAAGGREFTEGSAREIGSRRIVPRIAFDDPLQQRGGGSIDLEAAAGVIRDASDDWMSCYVRRLARRPDASGEVVVKFTVADNGTVNLAHGTTNTVGGEVGECIAERVQGLEFSSVTPGGVYLRQTMHFERRVLETETVDTDSPESPPEHTSADADVQVTVADTYHRRGAGSIELEAVRDELRGHTDTLESCYRSTQKVGAPNRGEIVVQFTVDTDGTVSLSHVTNDSLGGDTGECVSDTIEKIEYPAPVRGSVFLEQTFQFRPGND
jgi:outer membrane biosynthesis protein TonB